MAIVGLLYVGAVLFINGLMLLGGRPSGRAINLFVGALAGGHADVPDLHRRTATRT